MDARRCEDTFIDGIEPAGEDPLFRAYQEEEEELFGEAAWIDPNDEDFCDVVAYA